MNEMIDRRGFFSWSSRGLGAAAFAHLLQQEAQAREVHLKPRATRVIHICLIGGLSHIDSFDPKPELDRRHGQPLDSKEQPDVFFGKVGLLRKADWAFKKRGESGLEISELFPHIAKQADLLTVIRSMRSDSANHTPALYVQNSGFQFSGFPSVGAWASYGLGNESDDLPAYVVLPDPRGQPNGGASIWSNGFLPAQHQGTIFGAGETPVRDLFPTRPVNGETEIASRDLLQQMNKSHQDRHGADPLLAARMRSYELAAKMQLSVPEIADVGRETVETHRLFGMDDPLTAPFARNCLLARRLLERGSRFVQLFSGGPVAGNPRVSWDAHENVKDNHTAEASRIDKPIAGLLIDLKRRGMLDDTVVAFTTEFGRTPFTQAAGNTIGTGRDHNKYGFSVWLAGAGLKPGISFGATDPVGWKAVENPVEWYDFHATLLHLLGLNHERLTFYHNGIYRRLTNVHGEVIRQILA